MAATMKVRTDTLNMAAQRLAATAGELESLCASLPRIMSPSLMKTSRELNACKTRSHALASRMRRVSNGTRVASRILSSCEQGLVRKARWAEKADGHSEKSNHDVNDLIFDAIGGLGLPGGIIGGLLKWNYDPSTKNLVKFVSKGGKSIVKWAGFEKDLTDIERNRKLFGLDKYLKTPSEAAKWGTRFKENFEQGFMKGFWDNAKDGKVVDKGKLASNLFTWGAAAITSGIDNYQEYKSGKISGDRAVIEWGVETVATVALTAAIGGAIAALGGSVIAVAVGGAVVKWGADWVCKQVTGKGVVESVGYAVGEVYDFGKKVNTEINKIVQKGVDHVARQAKATLVNAKNTLVNWFNPPKLAW